MEKQMTAESVLQVVDAAAAAYIDLWLDGGWGIDALLGEQTRAHADLDVILRLQDASRLEEVLNSHGFQTMSGGSSDNFVLADTRGREVDVHAIRFDERGYGTFSLPGGQTWPFPPSAFAGEGRVAGQRVRCLSAEAQVQCHGQGYAPSEKDLCDMELLQARFQVILPLHLCRLGR